MKITQSELIAAADRIYRELNGDVLMERPAGYMSIREYSEIRSISHKGAANALENGVRKGKLVKVKVWHRGNGWQWLYREAKPDAVDTDKRRRRNR